MLLFCNNRENIKLRNESERVRRSGIISQSVEYFENDENIVRYPKTLKEENSIRLALERNEFLSNVVQGNRLQHFIDCMYSKEVKEGEIIIRKGDIGSCLYISNKGTYRVIFDDNFVSMFEDIRVFGELAILYSAKRHATIECVEKGYIWILDCHIFKKLVVKSAIEEHEEMVSFLEKVPKLNTVPKEKLYEVANLLKPEFFATSKQIVTEGEIGNKFYIVRAGSVTVEKNNSNVAQLSRGQFFGELALLNEKFRQATVTADAPGVECLTLTSKEFIEHFGGIENFIALKSQQVNVEKCIEHSELNLEDFKRIATLGIGGFGRVELVQHNVYKDQTFALKSMKKIEILGRSHQDQVYNERNLQMSCNSQFIVRLYRTYKDSKYIYLLLEVCLGGDLWNLLHKQKKHHFEESAAKFYSGCVLEALAYLHKRGIIYRDLKPENIMVHNNGYLKLTDFGFVKQLHSKEKSYTFVGTAEYVAPEIILNKGHNKAVDYWALGVLIYELLVGRTPFHTNDPGHLKTYKLILKGIDHVVFPYFVTSKAKSLIKKLCMPSPSDRLGCRREGVNDIKFHPWFSGFSWHKLKNLQMRPPFKPDLLSNTDIQHFDKFKVKRSIPPDDYSTWDDDF